MATEPSAPFFAGDAHGRRGYHCLGRSAQIIMLVDRSTGIAFGRHHLTMRPFGPDSPLEGAGFELVWGFPVKQLFWVCYQFFVRSGKAVPRSVHDLAASLPKPTSGSRLGADTLAGVPVRS
jgi:hypothetical protein